MPEDWATFSKTNPEDAIRMRVKDPELVSLLNNNAPAQLKAEALTGNFPDVAPTEQERAEAQRRARVQEIFDQKPFGGNGRPVNMSLCLELAKLDPALHAQLEANFKQSGPSEDELLIQQTQRKAAHERARHESQLKGVQLAQAETMRRRFR